MAPEIPMEKMASVQSGLDVEVNLKSAEPLRLRLEWNNVVLTKKLPQGPFFKRTVVEKQILKGVFGSAEPGELLSIMGPSGGGKTSLLNSLSRRAKISSGKVTLNGKKIPKNFNKISAYVMQDDRLFEVLTPRELFQFSANLRLPRDMTASERKQMVERVIAKLKISSCADTRVGGRLMRGLSGGERKRTAIGIELITNPSLLFLDEPTSGLDSFTALSLIQTLKELASEGHTIICTIHQPSSEIFALFDKLNLLVRGEVAFFGRPTDSIDFFGKLGHPCPTYTNPADFFMTLLQTQSEEEAERASKIVAAFKEMRALPDVAEEPDAASLEPIESPDRPPFWVQLLELTKRSWTVIVRNPLTFHARVIQFVIISILVGCIYYKLGFTNSDVGNRSGALFFLAVGPIMSSVNAVLLTFPLERALLVREQTNGMYGVASYFLGKTFSNLPLDVFFPTLICCISYWMVGFNSLQASRFFLHWVIVVGLCFCASSMGLFLGSMLPNPEVAVSMAPVVVIPFMLFAGFYIKIESIPIWLRWLQYLSIFKWGYQGLFTNEFHDTPYNCTESELITVVAEGHELQVCPITNGNQVLENMNLSYPYDYELAIGVIVALGVGFRILSFIFLYWQTMKGVKKDQ